uniref:Uncharacterized protein n=1 Tax=Podoviridae sp. ctJDl18 TaxID=2825242 RepID=A0A8S5V0Q9_9CAUD|nr:MAG TPA: hypothetical protein [Podoviridae sp. ctJDl18]
MSTINYKIASMQVASSQITKEKYGDEGNTKIGNSFAFTINEENCLLLCSHKLVLKKNEQVFAEVTLETIFAISPDSFNEMKKDGKIVISKGFLIQCGSISYGTLRGIVLQDSRKVGLENIIIPPLYVDTIIKEPMIVDSKEKK